MIALYLALADKLSDKELIFGSYLVFDDTLEFLHLQYGIISYAGKNIFQPLFLLGAPFGDALLEC